MERLGGRILWSPALPELPREERRPIYLAMCEALARLHLVDWQAAGLADFGRPGNYYLRQINRWTRQWRGSQTREDTPHHPPRERRSPHHTPPARDTAPSRAYLLAQTVFHS